MICAKCSKPCRDLPDDPHIVEAVELTSKLYQCVKKWSPEQKTQYATMLTEKPIKSVLLGLFGCSISGSGPFDLSKDRVLFECPGCKRFSMFNPDSWIVCVPCGATMQIVEEQLDD